MMPSFKSVGTLRCDRMWCVPLGPLTTSFADKLTFALWQAFGYAKANGPLTLSVLLRAAVPGSESVNW